MEIEEMVKSLPPDLKKEVEDFIQFLLNKRKKGKLKLDWAGALAEYKNKYDAISLQKKAIEWWGD